MASGTFDRENVDPRQSQQPRRPGPNAGYQFNSDEMRVLKECNRESFFQRCLPLSTALGGGLYYGVKSGFLSGHAKYGATPKVVIGVVVGYFVGKFSYRNKCAEKLMQLPGSPIGDMLRRRKCGSQESGDTGFGSSISLTPFSGMNPSDTYTDFPQSRNSLDIDTSRPDSTGLDDAHRPSLDNPVYEEEEMPPIQSHTTTYDELRRKNREDFQQKRVGRSPQGDYVAPSSTPQTEPLSKEYQVPKASTNKYGDSWS